jgi:hypothetical protein
MGMGNNCGIQMEGEWNGNERTGMGGNGMKN